MEIPHFIWAQIICKILFCNFIFWSIMWQVSRFFFFKLPGIIHFLKSICVYFGDDGYVMNGPPGCLHLLSASKSFCPINLVTQISITFFILVVIKVLYIFKRSSLTPCFRFEVYGILWLVFFFVCVGGWDM